MIALAVPSIYTSQLVLYVGMISILIEENASKNVRQALHLMVIIPLAGNVLSLTIQQIAIIILLSANLCCCFTVVTKPLLVIRWSHCVDHLVISVELQKSHLRHLQ